MPTEPAPAKINLYLHLTGRRADGYHLLDSLAAFPAIGDRIDAEPADDLTLSLEGPFAPALRRESNNLVLRAARALAAEAGIPAHARLTLWKALPVAAGIGGGSADAAAALRACARLWRLPWDAERMAAIAVGLGADVPVCLASRPARMGGIGDILSPAPTLPACGIVLANPGVAVSTPEVFKARQGRFSGHATLPPAWDSAATMAHDLAALGNDLAAAAIALRPVIADLLAAFDREPDCLLARMSGSGATCWGLFETPALAECSANRIKRPGWWVWGGGLFAG